MDNPKMIVLVFLDASSHLCKRMCLSVGPSVGVGPSVSSSIGPSAH